MIENGTHFTRYLENYIAPPDIHDVKRLPLAAAEMTLTVILAIIMGLVDLCLIWAALSHGLPGWMCLLLHIAMIVLAGLFTAARAKGNMDTRAAAMTVLLVAVAGPFGALGAILMALSHLFFRDEGLSFAEWFRFIYPRPVPSLGETLYDDIITAADIQPKNYDVVPFTDVMRLGSSAQKREAINRMTLQFHPRFAEAFQLALKDSALSVRTLAATSISRIEHQLADQERRLHGKLTHHNGEQSPELLLAAAQFYDDYAFSGILDTDRQQRFYNQAYEYYQRYLRRRSNDHRVAVWIGRLLIRSGQLERAAQWLKQLLDEGKTDGQLLSWYAEVLFNLGRFQELRQFMSRYRANLQALETDERFQTLGDSIRLWTEQEAA